MKRTDDASERCSEDGGVLLVLGSGDDRIGTVAAGRFIITNKLGSGGMGTVYRAYQTSTHREIALKLLSGRDLEDVEFVERFTREARATARLRSPHTVIVHDFGKLETGELFIAMELISGRSLEEIIREEAPLDPARVARIMGQVLESLEEAHGLGLVHRDIKPSNIMIARGATGLDHAKVLDFGLVKVVGTAQEAGLALTQAGMIYGTPPYMAPELFADDPGAIGPWTDFYALGVVAYAMLSGKNPFQATSLAAYIAKHLNEKPPPLEPSPIARIIERCLAKDRRERAASAAQLRAEIESSTGGTEETLIRANAEAPKVQADVATKTRAPSPRWWLIGVALVVAGALIAVPMIAQREDVPVTVTQQASTTSSQAAALSTPDSGATPAAHPIATKAQARAELRSIHVVGTLPEDAAARALAPLSPAVARCARPGKAALMLHLIVLADGRVSSAKATPESDPSAKAFEECILAHALRLRFPPFSGALFSTISADVARPHDSL
jgi:serine/threonine-protein kinase